MGSYSGKGEAAETGQAVMKGDDPLHLKIANTAPVQIASATPYLGRYPCGSLVYNGVWYYGTYCLGPAPEVNHEGMKYNWPVLGSMPGFRVSQSGGRTLWDLPA